MNNLNLEIKDFGVINHANIELNKITIVGGVNDSGKSTVCRLLYCFLKSNFLSQKEAVMKVLVEEFNTIFTNPPQDFTVDDDFEYMINEYKKTKDRVNNFPNGKLKTQNVDSLINLLKLFESMSSDSSSDNKIFSIIANELIYKEGLIRLNGYSELYSQSFKSMVNIDVPANEEGVFCSVPKNLSKCKTNGDISSSPNVYYIDCFSILNIFNHRFSDLNLRKVDNIGLINHIDSLINDIYELGNMGQAFTRDQSYSKIVDEVNGIIRKIHELIPGYFQPTFFINDFAFEKDGLLYPTYNTSSGIKQIGIIELLIEKKNHAWFFFNNR